ncbi:MAG: PAS domain S-box protein, partial [bacterium]
MKGNIRLREFGKKYILIIVFTSILISALFVLYYFHERSTIVAMESKDLKSVFEIKSRQIAKWINERIIDGQYIKSSPTVKKYLLNPFDDTLRKELKKRLAGFSLDDSYGNVRVFDKEMNHLFSSGIELGEVGKELKDYIEKAADKDSVILSDFFSCEFHHRVHLELIIPISDDGKNIGFVLIDVLPEAYLYQMMQSYPLSSKTSEILIVRREGDSVVYLNNLRHKPDAALKFTIPLSSQDVPAVKAVLGERGFITGIDYRGKKVLAYIDSVPFMDWHMVTKIDLSEVYSSLSYKFLVGIIILLFSLSIVSSFMLFFWLSDRNKFLSKELEREKKLKILNSYLETIVETAPVAIYDIDVDGRVKSIWNREAEMMFGIAKADVIGKMLPIVSELRREEFDGLRSRVLDGNPFRGLEVEGQRIDKSKICLSLSTAPTFDLNGKADGVIAIALDITEKKKQETELKESISNLETLNEELQTSEEELISAEEELRTQVEELELSQKSLMESEEKFRIALKNA